MKSKNNQTIIKIKSNELGFTLVELIVVITILAILWTIAFISLQWYSAQARDSKRLSDISNIKKSLELFSLNTWKYPLPDNKITISYSWEPVRYQWYIWEQVSTNLSRNLNEKPIDPLTEWEYIYSTTYSQTEYEVLGLYESDLIWTNVVTPFIGVLQSNAEGQDYPKIDWNYNWIYIKTANFYVPTPSIINAEIVSNDDLSEDNIKSQVVTGGNNIPLTSTWRLNITLSVYTWTIVENSTDEEKIALLEKLKTAYSWSQLASDTMYVDILSRTSSWEMVDFVDLVILNSSQYTSLNSNTLLNWNDDYTKLLLHGANFTDSSNSSHVLSLNWDPIVSDTWKFDKSISFDWNWDYLSIPDSEDWNFWGEDFTIDFWVNRSLLNHDDRIFGQYNTSNTDYNIELYINSSIDPISNRFTFLYSTNGTNWDNLSGRSCLGSTDIPANTWIHISVVRNNTEISTYVNWVHDKTWNVWILELHNSSADVRIWASHYHDWERKINWYLDELRVSKWIARTQDPNDYMYDPEWDGFTTPTVPYWN